jgi:hypothetical protein
VVKEGNGIISFYMKLKLLSSNVRELNEGGKCLECEELTQRVEG